MAKSKLTKAEKVAAYMSAVDHPLLEVVEALRKIIAGAHKKIEEDISWNAPAFYYTGVMKPFKPKEYKNFIVGFNLFKKDCIRLIFLTGSKLNDKSGLLQGDYADGRRLAMFYNIDDVKSNEKTLQKLIKKWISMVDK